MPRIQPIVAPYEPDVARQLTAMMPPGVPPIGLFRTFVRNRPMTDAMASWGAYELSRNLSLTMRDREIVIDRVCARCGCDYEWGVHVAYFADRVGLTPEQLASLAAGTSSDSCWTSDRDQVVISAVDALHDDADIDDELWEHLRGHFDDAQLLDLLFLAGWYHAICFVARAARVDVEPWAPSLHITLGGVVSSRS